MFHDRASAIALAIQLYPGDFTAILAAIDHIDLDLACSRDPYYESYVELQAKLDSRRRRHLPRALR
jgi:hypothetical protein